MPQTIENNKGLPAVHPREEWTIAVDLTLNMRGVGAEGKSTLLKSLAEQSANKPVAIVVQVHKPQPETTQSQGAGANGTAEYERYAIEGGHIQNLPSPDSKSAADNLTDLVTTAGTNYPSNQLGLVIFSHGIAFEGIKTDTGPIPMPILASSIERALHKLGREKLGVVGYDACLMGEMNVMARSQDYAKHVVASPELVPCQDKDACGLNLNNWFGALLEHPDMSALAFGNAEVDAMSVDARARKHKTGPSFVGNYDLGESFVTLEKSLNTFGWDMADAMDGDAGNRQQLKKIVAQTEKYDRFIFNAMDNEPKDLVDFASRVKASVASGELKDSTGKIANDADNLIQSYQKVLSSSFAAPFFDAMQSEPTPAYLAQRDPQEKLPYNKLGGLSIFLPDGTNEPALKEHPEIVDEQISSKLPGWKSFVEHLVD